MYIKIYENKKEIINKLLKHLAIGITIFLLFTIPLPNKSIIVGGGINEIGDRILIDNILYDNEDTFYMSYVSQIKATIPYYIYSLLNPSWQVIKVDDSNNDNTGKILLNTSVDYSIMNAYKLANKELEIKEVLNTIVYIHQEAKTTLEIGDYILEVEGYEYNEDINLTHLLQDKQINDIVNFKVISNNQIVNKTATVFEVDEVKVNGISIIPIYKYETNPSIEIEFKKEETGSSAGLMLTLSIYEHLTNCDLIRNRKIVGTGTIDIDGNVYPIGGVIHKFKAAVEEEADIFIVPSIDNYDEVMKIQNEENYNIEVITVSTIQEAIEKLMYD